MSIATMWQCSKTQAKAQSVTFHMPQVMDTSPKGDENVLMFGLNRIKYIEKHTENIWIL